MLVMEKKASDNKYLHRDFHISADNGIEYVGKKYGDEGVIDFLTRYAKTYFIPLVDNYKKVGLKAIKEYIENIYKTEEASDAILINLSDKSLSVKVNYCPAVKYMKSQGHTPSKWYKMSTSVVYDVLAKECNLQFKMGYYDEQNGATEYSFIKEDK